MKEKSAIITELEKDLVQYNSVLLYMLEDEKLLIRILDKAAGDEEGVKSVKIYVPASEKEVRKEYAEKECIHVVSIAELNELLSYYRMYEFSNRLKVLEDNERYGGLMNYFRAELLTEEELLNAILG